MAETTGPGPMLRLGLVVASSFTTYTMVLTLVPLYSLDLGAPVALVGLLTASLSFFPLLLAVRTGTLVDRYGPRRLLILGAMLLTATPLFAVAAPSLVALFAVQIAGGLANLLAVVAGQAYTASLGSAAKREGHFGWYTTFVSAGQVVGPVIAGVVADAYGFRWAFATAAALALVAVASSMWLRDVRSRGEADEAEPTSLAREYGRARSLLRGVGIQFAVAITFAVAFAQGAFTAFFPVILETAGFSASVIGGLLSLRAAVSMVLRPMVPLIARLLGQKRRALKVMLVLIVGTFVAIGASPTFTVALVGCIVAGVWWGVSPPLSIVMMVEGVGARQRGFALGVRLMANRLAQLTGPLAVGFIADGLSLRAGFFGVGAVLSGFFLALLPSGNSTDPVAEEEATHSP